MPYRRRLILFMLLAAGAQAQWLNYPTPGTPRTRDGKPDLSAPTPRTADGKPDLTGVWMHETTSVAEVKRLFGNAFDADIQLAPPGMEIGTQHKYAFNIFADLKPEEVPLRPEAAEALRKQAAARQSGASVCTGATGIPVAVSCLSRSRLFKRPG